MELPLVGGSYSARSVIANAQRCVNYYPEANRRDSPTAYTLYQRPGRRRRGGPPTPGQGRGLYRASNGKCYAVCGEFVYSIDAGFVFTLLGSITSGLVSQVSFSDNGTEVMLVDGSNNGWKIDLASDALSLIVDPTGAFQGATRVAYIDTFTIFNYPGTRDFGSTLSNVLQFDALYIAGKSGYPDPLVSLTVNRREIVLFGELKSEIWYDAGGAAFPFAALPGAYIEHGCLAPFSVASWDIDTFWLSQDLQGDALILRLRGYDVARVSNHALEYALEQMQADGADLSEAIAFTYQFGGHVFYQITFPSGNQTWVYDSSVEDPTMAWHQEAWQNPAGGEERMRDGAGAFVFGRNMTLDRETGELYEIDPELYVDQVNGADQPIVCVRGFPHIAQAVSRESGQMVSLDGKRIQARDFKLNMDCGLSPLPGQVVGLRWSWDRGHTWGYTVLQPAGAPGEYFTQPNWEMLGAQGRDLVIEVVHQINGQAALQGGWIEINILNT